MKVFFAAGRLAVVAGVVAVLACDSTEPRLQPGPATALLVVAGNDQTGTVDQELSQPLIVRVVDAAGLGVPGQIVNFRVTAGHGEVFAGAAITSDSGFAGDRWVLGKSTADSQRVEARAVSASGQPLVFGVFRATAIPGAPASLLKVAGDAQQGSASLPLADSLTARLVDAFGNGVSGATITWQVATGGGAVAPLTTTTGNDGIARARWTLGPSGAQQATATASTGSVSFTAQLRAATALGIQTPASEAAGGQPFTTQPVIRVQDASGNLVPTATNAITVAVGGGATLIGTATVSAVNGVATFSGVGVSAPAGTYTLTYSSSGMEAATQQIVVSPGTPTQYVVTASSNPAEVGNSVTVSAQVADANGTAVAGGGRVVTWSVTGAGGSFASPTSTTNAAGVASVAFTLNTTFTAGTATLKATEGSITGQTTIAVTTGPAASLAFATQPANGGWRVQLDTVRVALRDQYGNTVTSSSASVALSLAGNPSGATLSGGGPVNAVDGIAKFANLVVDEAGSGFTLQAQSGALPVTTSAAFDVAAIGTLVSLGSRAPRALEIAGGTLFFLDDAGVVRSIGITGGAATTRYTESNIWTNSRPNRLVSDGLFMNLNAEVGSLNRTGKVVRIPIGGGSIGSVPLNGRIVGPEMLYDGTFFYTVFTNNYNIGGFPPVSSESGGIMRIDTAGNRIDLLRREPFDYVPAIALSGGFVYYTDSSAAGIAIQKVPIDSGTATTIVDGLGNVIRGTRGALLIVGGRIYWSESSGVLRSMPVDGGLIATQTSVSAGRMISDGTYLYVATLGGSIVRYDLATFGSTLIVANEGVTDITIAGSAIYWTSNVEGKRAVRKAAR